MKTKTNTLPTLAFLMLIVCILTGCGTTGTNENPNNQSVTPLGSDSQASSENSSNENKVEKFLDNKTDLIVAKFEEKVMTEDEIRTAKKRLDEGWDFNIFGFFDLNASSNGVIYKRKFLKENNGSIETGIDDDGDPFFVLAIAF